MNNVMKSPADSNTLRAVYLSPIQVSSVLFPLVNALKGFMDSLECKISITI